MHRSSRVVMLERKLPERIENPDDSFTTVMGDVHMMVVLGGKERTTNQYRDLLTQAGLRMTSEIPIEADITAFEALIAVWSSPHELRGASFLHLEARTLCAEARP